MPDSKADRKKARDAKKKEVTDALKAAKQKLDGATTAAQIDEAIAAAGTAKDVAVDMATKAFQKSTAPNHTTEDEDVEVELRDFSTQVQVAAETIRTQGERKKANL